MAAAAAFRVGAANTAKDAKSPTAPVAPVAAAAAAAAPASGASGPSQPKQTVARLLVWNLLAHEYSNYNTPDAKVESPELRNDRWAKQVLLLEANADIASLQEVTSGFLDYAFDGKLPDDTDAKTVDKHVKKAAGRLAKTFWRTFCVRKYLPGAQVKPGRGPKPDGCAILARSGMFADPLSVSIAMGQFPLEASVSATDPRCYVVVALRTKAGGDACVLACTHLEGAPGEKNSDIRLKQLECVQDVILSVCVATHAERLSVLTGDFNERPTEQLVATIQSGALTPLALAKPPQEAHESYTSIFGAIDYIAVSDPTLCDGLTILPLPANRPKKDRYNPVPPYGERSGVAPSPYLQPPYVYTAWPSDHWALQTTIRLP